MSQHRVYRVAISGGPGAGKTTAINLLQREFIDEVAVVPEVATMLFSGGYPRSGDPRTIPFLQNSIYNVQKNLENTLMVVKPESRVHLCDRGTVDAEAYWPTRIPGDEGHLPDFYQAMGTTKEKELARYDAVIFFETAAAAGEPILEGANPARNESLEEAVAIDQRLQEVWKAHPRYYFVSSEKSFMAKISKSCHIIHSVVRGFLTEAESEESSDSPEGGSSSVPISPVLG
mmetsp:Transcript_24277/g.68013  ORF Transcript_24277/g.68013 Transcript_24277/m.68013 type:complete len:231 (-) Transcript_24277:101-793(-)|eukprot:CAMPEP_0119124168 /NCGR_PEP_ID=MMETSP1310-20130426/3864_1 /TAXON_ID=464262 /ORGANISM="Genus nov. species nov., Strain RCC2339" /LENGTH=230 /DNA_ID=CAMNT_0007114077 /DNA_START=235 /DNA_END=927 /DNA_ORIENTATION=-